MNKLILTLSAGALALTGGTLALAKHHGGERHNPDLDGDGQITLEEANAHGARMFERMDANGDGVLNAEDRAAKRAERFAKMDADGDGEVTQAEAAAAHEARADARTDKRAEKRAERFARLDTDGSGGVSPEELAAGTEARKGERGAHHDRRGHRGPMAMLRRADANGDKTVTRDEFNAAIAERFARADTDNSGAISEDERKVAREAMRERRKERRQGS